MPGCQCSRKATGSACGSKPRASPLISRAVSPSSVAGVQTWPRSHSRRALSFSPVPAATVERANTSLVPHFRYHLLDVGQLQQAAELLSGMPTCCRGSGADGDWTMRSPDDRFSMCAPHLGRTEAILVLLPSANSRCGFVGVLDLQAPADGGRSGVQHAARAASTLSFHVTSVDCRPDYKVRHAGRGSSDC